ncbi:hypothetical protein AM1_B0067 (plasmid) [Acaryochloris marina MBIC11017]|uniref:Uncharacterized protein n=2 Tax=Acaryochloris marina TaxID=155978 RepID=A8ZM24_ACAM1|nr:hypothetical protein AM1_B0067 [Acaryochloris marina MBIC11017]
MQISKRASFLLRLLAITLLAVVLDSRLTTKNMSQPHPEQRSFYQGFIYQPYDWSDEAFEETFRVIGENSDIIGFYFDGFVPWNEAAAKKPYHPVQEQEIQKRINGIKPHQKIFLGTSLLGSDRVSLSGYLGEYEVPRTGKWKDKTFDDPEVIAAYLHWCRDLITRFQPDYFMYVAEVDSGLVNVDDPRFQSLLRSVKQIYPVLKREFPSLPILIEFVLENDEQMSKRAEVTQSLLPYTDMYAVSTFPFIMTGGNPADIPKDWFSRAKEIAPDIPFAVVETNFLAEDFYHPTQGIPIPFRKKRLLIPAREKWQAAYIEFLLSEAHRLEAEFVLYWGYRDLDQLQAKLDGTGGAFDSNIHGFASLSKDCGLIDEKGRHRPSFNVWQRWLSLPRS